LQFVDSAPSVDGLQTAPAIFTHVTAKSQGLAAVVIREPGRVPLRLLLGGPAVEVGRDCQGLLLTDPQISRRHLSLQEASGEVRVTDLGSRNGTRVDGTPIDGAHVLAPGQVVQLGATTIALWLDTPSATAPVHGRPDTSIERLCAAVTGDLGTPVIVFCDIENSRHRAVEFGDDRWAAVLEVNNSIVRRKVARHRGSEIASEADGFMLGFPSARNAVSCMVDVQRAVSALARSRPADRFRMRVGAHAGEVPGENVHVAARVAEAARGGEILVSEAVRELIGPKGGFRFGPARVVSLESLGGEQLAHPVEWEDPID
jgi:class 3 adenylate cyclase